MEINGKIVKDLFRRNSSYKNLVGLLGDVGRRLQAIYHEVAIITESL